MRSRFGSLCLLLVALAAPVPAAEGTPLDAREADLLVDEILARQKKLERLEATVFITKTGGMFRRPRHSRGILKASLPDRFLLVDQGDPNDRLPESEWAIYLFDGRSFWEIEPRYSADEPREASRKKWRTALDEGQGANLISLLLGRDVGSAEDLRRDFSIEAMVEKTPDGALTHHLILARSDGTLTIELWFRPGAALPWKARTTTVQKVKRFSFGRGRNGGGETRTHVEEQLLRDVRTNLNGLPPLPPETFLFPLERDMIVRDGKGEPIPHETIRRDLEELRRTWARPSP